MHFPRTKSVILAVLYVVVVIVCNGSSNENVPQAENRPPFDPETSLRFTVLYDNYVYTQGTETDWGFSCLIEGTERTILFDTGTQPSILFHNIDRLNVSIDDIDVIVISHQHGDHTGGLLSVLNRNPNVTVYLLESFSADFVRSVENTGAEVVLVDDSLQICACTYSTGELGVQIKEQSLVLDTSEGLIVVTGCSHPGIVTILERAREIVDKDIALVFGGFHLMNASDQDIQDIIERFRELGVQVCGPSHCTGDRQISLFRDAFGEDFVQMGTGRTLIITK
jgi:7,8-dihydropterin-6-yl-methyl-4-(beta-D-ribofuranosyl)aminobenzene 5'-phosphate synthase